MIASNTVLGRESGIIFNDFGIPFMAGCSN